MSPQPTPRSLVPLDTDAEAEDIKSEDGEYGEDEAEDGEDGGSPFKTLRARMVLRPTWPEAPPPPAGEPRILGPPLSGSYATAIAHQKLIARQRRAVVEFSDDEDEDEGELSDSSPWLPAWVHLKPPLPRPRVVPRIDLSFIKAEEWPSPPKKAAKPKVVEPGAGVGLLYRLDEAAETGGAADECNFFLDVRSEDGLINDGDHIGQASRRTSKQYILHQQRNTLVKLASKCGALWTVADGKRQLFVVGVVFLQLSGVLLMLGAIFPGAQADPRSFPAAAHKVRILCGIALAVFGVLTLCFWLGIGLGVLEDRAMHAARDCVDADSPKGALHSPRRGFVPGEEVAGAAWPDVEVGGWAAQTSWPVPRRSHKVSPSLGGASSVSTALSLGGRSSGDRSSTGSRSTGSNPEAKRRRPGRPSFGGADAIGSSSSPPTKEQKVSVAIQQIASMRSKATV